MHIEKLNKRFEVWRPWTVEVTWHEIDRWVANTAGRAGIPCDVINSSSHNAMRSLGLPQPFSAGFWVFLLAEILTGATSVPSQHISFSIFQPSTGFKQLFCARTLAWTYLHLSLSSIQSSVHFSSNKFEKSWLIIHVNSPNYWFLCANLSLRLDNCNPTPIDRQQYSSLTLVCRNTDSNTYEWMKVVPSSVARHGGCWRRVCTHVAYGSKIAVCTWVCPPSAAV